LRPPPIFNAFWPLAPFHLKHLLLVVLDPSLRHDGFPFCLSISLRQPPSFLLSALCQTLLFPSAAAPLLPDSVQPLISSLSDMPVSFSPDLLATRRAPSKTTQQGTQAEFCPRSEPFPSRCRVCRCCSSDDAFSRLFREPACHLSKHYTVWFFCASPHCI